MVSTVMNVSQSALQPTMAVAPPLVPPQQHGAVKATQGKAPRFLLPSLFWNSNRSESSFHKTQKRYLTASSTVTVSIFETH